MPASASRAAASTSACMPLVMTRLTCYAWLAPCICVIVLHAVWPSPSCGIWTGVRLALQVNATGVMPVIFSSTLLSLPSGLARSQPWLAPVAAQLGPTGPLFLPVRFSFTCVSRLTCVLALKPTHACQAHGHTRGNADSSADGGWVLTQSIAFVYLHNASEADGMQAASLVDPSLPVQPGTGPMNYTRLLLALRASFTLSIRAHCNMHSAL